MRSWPRLLAVAIPSMVYTATVMTENAFYPVFLVTALLLVRMIERPTWRAQVAFLAAVALALLTRAQAIAIVPAALTAPLLLGVFARTGLRAALWPYRLLYALVGAGAALVVAAQIARGRSFSSLLGAYSVVGHQSYGVGKPLRYLVYHLAELDLYLGAIPVAVAIVLVARSRSLDRPLQAFLAVTLALTGWFAVVVATFASQFANRIQERNLFVLVPLFVVLLLAWVERGAPRPRYLAPVAAVASALFVLAIPFETFITTSSVSDTLMLLPWWAVLDKIGIGLGRAPGLSVVRALRCSAAVRATPLCDRTTADRPRLLGRRVQADLVRAVSVRRQASGSGCPVPGHPGRAARLDRSRRAHGSRRRRAMDGSQ